DALHKRVRRQHLQAYRTGDHWFVVLENLPKAPEDESPLLARAEEPPAPANEQPSGSSNGYHRDDTGAPGASPATEEPQPASPAAETAVLEPTASAEAEAPPAAESVTAAQPEETAAQGTAFEEPPAAQEQPASEAPVAEAAVPEEQAAAEGQLAPEERLATQERPAEEEQAGVAEQSVAEDEAVAVATEQTAAGEEQDQEQELVAVGVVAVAHEQFAAAGEAPAGGAAAGEAPSRSAAAEAPAREAAGETEATEEPAAGPEPAPEAEAATPVSSHQLFDALSAGGPAEAEVLQQLRAEIAFLRQQMREKDRQIAAWITESRRKDLSVTRLENRLRVVPGERGRARTETELSNASTSDLLAAREQLMAPLAERLYQLEDRLGRLEARRTARQPTPWYRRLIGSGSDPQNVT
ncbi:MAG TPA: hypothetical protein VFI42_06405, partial [Thermomicrobiaceae bacterium]|nr:hypothetical protein [Thermomicrobiaceae bacterium]